VSFAAITLCVASQWAFIIVVYFVIDSIRKLWIHHRMNHQQVSLVQAKPGHEPTQGLMA
jgi:lipoprotein signal peptidase